MTLLSVGPTLCPCRCFEMFSNLAPKMSGKEMFLDVPLPVFELDFVF
jgi:hypothetical protein